MTIERERESDPQTSRVKKLVACAALLATTIACGREANKPQPLPPDLSNIHVDLGYSSCQAAAWQIKADLANGRLFYMPGTYLALGSEQEAFPLRNPIIPSQMIGNFCVGRYSEYPLGPPSDPWEPAISVWPACLEGASASVATWRSGLPVRVASSSTGTAGQLQIDGVTVGVNSDPAARQDHGPCTPGRALPA